MRSDETPTTARKREDARLFREEMRRRKAERARVVLGDGDQPPIRIVDDRPWDAGSTLRVDVDD